MLKTIVDIYPDESVYSWLSRIYIRSGYGVLSKFHSELYENSRASIPSIVFCGGFNKRFLELINEVIPYSELVTKHTLLKYYIRFLDLKRRRKVFDKAINNESGIYNLVAVEMGKDDYYLRYCPKCVEEDRKKFGEAYYHINHFFPRVHICSKHNCKLINTEIEISNYKKKSFIPLECVVDEMKAEEVNKNDINLKIARYINKLFNEEISFGDNIKIGDYLTSKLNKKYIKRITGFRDNCLLSDLLNEYYSDVDGYKMTAQKLQTIFLNRNWNSFELSLVAMFEKINTSDLAYHKNYLDINDVCKRVDWEKLDIELTRRFTELVSGFDEIQKIDVNLDWVSEKLEIEKRYIKDNLPCLLRTVWSYRGKKNNWEKLDSSYCLKLNELIKTKPQLFEDKLITKAYIGSLLGVRDCSLRDLPELMKMVIELKKTHPYYKGMNWPELDKYYCEEFDHIINKYNRGEISFKMNYRNVGTILGIRDLSLKRLPLLRKKIKSQY